MRMKNGKNVQEGRMKIKMTKSKCFLSLMKLFRPKNQIANNKKNEQFIGRSF